MNYRAVCYFKALPAGIALARLESEAVETATRADQLLDLLVELPGVDGGHVEQHVPGIGWVLADDAQNAIDGHNRSEWDRVIDPADAPLLVG